MLKQKRTQWLKRIVIGLALLALAVLGTAWMMFQHIPDFYRPAQVPPEHEQAVRDNITATYDSLNIGLNESLQPFDHRFGQDQINAWLAMLERMWPNSRKWLPQTMSNPQIAIDPEGIRLAITYRYRDVRTVLSARFRASADKEGLALQLLGVYAGSLPMPNSQIRHLLSKIDTNALPVAKHGVIQIQDRSLPALASLFEGIRVPNTWMWENGEKPFRITRLKFEPGALVVTFEPLPHNTMRFRSWAHPD